MSFRHYLTLLLIASLPYSLRAQHVRSFSFFVHTCDSLLYAGDLTGGEAFVRSVLHAETRRTGATDSVKGYAHYMLGVFTLDQANYGTAEQELQQAIALNTALYSSHHPIVAAAWSRLARLYSEQSRYADAIRAASEQVSCYRVELGADDKFTALAGVAVAEYALKSGDVRKAEALTSSLAAPLMSGFGNASTESIRFQRLAGDISFGKRRYLEAEQIYSAALHLLSSSKEPRLELRASLELARARARAIVADPDSATQDVRRAEADLRYLNPASYGLPALCQLVKGSVQEMQSHTDSAFMAFSEALRIYRSAANANFSYTSERERLEFLREIHRTSGRVFSCAARTNLIFPNGAGSAYDWLLFEKAATLTSFSAVRSAIVRSGDSVANMLLSRIADLSSRRSALLGNDSLLLARPLRDADSIDATINQLQKQLVRLSASFARITVRPGLQWQTVRKHLRRDETAIELTAFPYYDGERLTDSILYSAFALNTKDTNAPRTMVIGSAAGLEDPALLKAYYHALEPGTKNREALTLVSNILWAPIAELAGDRKVIYLSPDGVYLEVSFAGLPIDEHTDVIDKYEISILANTADLLRDTSGMAPASIAIFADPRYTERRSIALNDPPLAREKRGLRELSGTRTEANNVAGLFRRAHWTVEQHMGAEASEANLEDVRGTRILHIATHATFSADSASNTSITNDLLGCALYLSGANSTLRHGSTDPHNDGVVSGLEASQLRLDGADLVTLSACESGRGVIEPGEGVFGLPRALRTAGARNILMSLWRVPDRETSELMSLFYKRLLQGDTKAAALRSAQLRMRTAIRKRAGMDEPLYWAGFELIGF